MPRDRHVRKLTGRHRFRDVSHMKLTDMFKSLRCGRFRRDVSRRSSLTHSRSFPPPPADHDSSPVQPPFPDLSTSSPLHISRYRSDAISILSATEEDCSSGMSTSSSVLERTPSHVARGRHSSPHPIPTFPTSPSMFQLRSASTKDYLVDQLEQHLRQLNLGDANSDGVALPKNSSRDIPMDVCPGGPTLDVINPKTSSRHARDTQKPMSSPDDQNVVPMILITSVDAKHPKPLPPSAQRPSRTPFGASNFIHQPTNDPSHKSKLKTPPDDPFTMQPYGSTYPPDYNLTFRLPSFPSAYSGPVKYAPETPTPMCCDHFGDCKGDLWEVLHPPLVAGRFTLPPFQLPPLNTGIFDDMSTPLTY